MKLLPVYNDAIAGPLEFLLMYQYLMNQQKVIDVNILLCDTFCYPIKSNHFSKESDYSHRMRKLIIADKLPSGTVAFTQKFFFHVSIYPAC